MEINGNALTLKKMTQKSKNFLNGRSCNTLFITNASQTIKTNLAGMEMDGNQKNDKINDAKYSCNFCNFYTSKKTNYVNHCLTPKHNKLIKNDEKMTKNDKSYCCQICQKEFETNAGLWKHKQTCKNTVQNEVVCMLMQQNQEYKEMLLLQSKEIANALLKKDDDLKALIVEICKNTQTNNSLSIQNTQTNVTNVNNTFNLNLFLNETCKDAMNLSDFVKGVKVSIDDIEHIGKVGYVDGLSDIIIKNLNELGVERRPIHCTDAKRQIVYVKEDDKWEKEDESMSRLKKMVCGVQQANFVTLKKWREMYPSCLTANSIYTDTYNVMSQELMGGDCQKVTLSAKDFKIISKVARGMTIDKTALVSI